MKKCCAVFFGILVTFIGYSQHPITPNHSALTLPQTHTYTVTQRLNDANEVVSYLINQHPLLNQTAYSIKKVTTLKSMTSIHYVFDVFKDGIQIHAAQIKIHTDYQGNVIMIHDNVPEISAFYSGISNLSKSVKWIQYNGDWQVATFEKTDDDFGRISILVGDKELDRIGTKHFYQTTDTQVKAQVFMVNPLNTAEKGYGSPYIDSSDLDVPALNAERKWVDMSVKYVNDTFWLRSDRYFIGHVSNPVTEPTFSLTDTFSFTRSQYQFEDVNAFYHVSNMSNHVESLGFKTALPDTLIIDAHAYSGGDFSSFNYGVNPVQLEFGEGGVDDAEDADVIIHEFGHAISHGAAPGSNLGMQRRSFDESFGDYLAERYGRRIGVTSTRVFDWDGNNEFWNGRSVSYDGVKNYNQLIFSSIYQHTDIMSSAMLEFSANPNVGGSVADEIILEGVHSLMPNQSFRQIAQNFIWADSLLYNGAHYNAITSAFGSPKNILATNSIAPSPTERNGVFIMHTPDGKVLRTEEGEEAVITLFNWSGQLLWSKTSLGQLPLPQGTQGVLQVQYKSGDQHTIKTN